MRNEKGFSVGSLVSSALIYKNRWYQKDTLDASKGHFSYGCYCCLPFVDIGLFAVFK